MVGLKGCDNMRLLLAEDETLLSDALVTILTHNGFTVDPVYNGNDALTYLEHGEYDGAILDIMMPGRSGLSVLTTLRQQGKTLPILLLTAKGEVDDRVKGLDAGADDYLVKPFDTKELLARIRSMLRRQPLMQTEDPSYGDITLSPRDFTLSGPSGGTKLLQKEYQMMELLLRNPGQVIPTQRFLEKIWGYDSDVEVNVVWVNISSLRKKLQTIGSRVTLKASRGVGYMLEVPK